MNPVADTRLGIRFLTMHANAHLGSILTAWALVAKIALWAACSAMEAKRINATHAMLDISISTDPVLKNALDFSIKTLVAWLLVPPQVLTKWMEWGSSIATLFVIQQVNTTLLLIIHAHLLAILLISQAWMKLEIYIVILLAQKASIDTLMVHAWILVCFHIKFLQARISLIASFLAQIRSMNIGMGVACHLAMLLHWFNKMMDLAIKSARIRAQNLIIYILMAPALHHAIYLLFWEATAPSTFVIFLVRVLSIWL